MSIYEFSIYKIGGRPLWYLYKDIDFIHMRYGRYYSGEPYILDIAKTVTSQILLYYILTKAVNNS